MNPDDRFMLELLSLVVVAILAMSVLRTVAIGNIAQYLRDIRDELRKSQRYADEFFEQCDDGDRSFNGRAPDCESGECGFDPHRPPHFSFEELKR